MIGNIIDWCGEMLADVDRDGEESAERLPVGVWAGFADLGKGSGHDLLCQLADAGVGKVVFTPTNDAASSAYKWQPPRAQIVRGLLAAKELGLEVWLGPWVRCDPLFLRSMGKQLRELADEVGGVDGWELDAEGSWEYTARSRGKRHPSGIAGAVADALGYLTEHLLDDEELGATVLYFNRPAGDALLRQPRVVSATVQAYSVWFPGSSSKAKATHTPQFQPGTLQERAWEHYSKFKTERSLERLEMGLGWWAQDRARAPASMRLSKGEAFRKASEACLALGCDGVMGWACHLWDSETKASEREYRDLVLREVRYLSETASPLQEEEVWPSDPAGIKIDWERRWSDPSVAQGGRPSGWRRVKGLGLDARLYRAAAQTIRAVAIERAWSFGVCVPFVQEGRHMIGVFQLHTATWRGGELVHGRYKGLTIFAIEEGRS
jgi:hypothetical protein